MAEWKLIETAPKCGEDEDDVWILAFRQGSKCPMVTTWDHERGCWYTYRNSLAGHLPRWEPTHWMPLPAPPVSESNPNPEDEEKVMTVGDEIWADAVRETGIWTLVQGTEAERWRQFALLVIRKINESHGIPEISESEER